MWDWLLSLFRSMFIQPPDESIKTTYNTPVNEHIKKRIKTPIARRPKKRRRCNSFSKSESGGYTTCTIQAMSSPCLYITPWSKRSIWDLYGVSICIATSPVVYIRQIIVLWTSVIIAKTVVKHMKRFTGRYIMSNTMKPWYHFN